MKKAAYLKILISRKRFVFLGRDVSLSLANFCGTTIHTYLV